MTKEELSKYGKVIPMMFASEVGDAGFNFIGSAKSGFTYQAGIPPMYSNRNGKKVPIKDVNGMGRMMSQAAFFNQNGGYWTFDKEVSNKIGGYPMGGILYFLDDENNQIRMVRSLIPDNTFDFVENPEYIDDIHWSYVDQVTPTGFRPRIFIDKQVAASSLDTNSQYQAKCDSLFVIQSGVDKGVEISGVDAAIYIWVCVQKYGEQEFHSAGLLSYIGPISSIYNSDGRFAQYIEPDMEQKANYTSQYSSSPITLFLKAGDTVKLSMNQTFSYMAQYKCFSLKS